MLVWLKFNFPLILNIFGLTWTRAVPFSVFCQETIEKTFENIIFRHLLIISMFFIHGFALSAKSSMRIEDRLMSLISLLACNDQ